MREAIHTFAYGNMHNPFRLFPRPIRTQHQALKELLTQKL
jgi:hypothetical protein